MGNHLSQPINTSSSPLQLPIHHSQSSAPSHDVHHPHRSRSPVPPTHAAHSAAPSSTSPSLPPPSSSRSSAPVTPRPISTASPLTSLQNVQSSSSYPSRSNVLGHNPTHSHNLAQLSSSPPSASAPSQLQIVTTSIDSGYLFPLSNIYPSSAQDYSHTVVQSLILSRKLAPFYRGLEDWDALQTTVEIEEALSTITRSRQQAIRSLNAELASAQPSLIPSALSSQSGPSHNPHHQSLSKRIGKSLMDRHQQSPSGFFSASAASSSNHPSSQPASPLNRLSPREQVFEAILLCDVRPTESSRYLPESLECPICFLYYPCNINYSRCCQQPICTECFVQIKRADPTPQDLKSEPACCPYCVESNFGVTYEPPPLQQRTGWTFQSSSALEGGAEPEEKARPKRRQTMFHTSEEVVTTDLIRDDWQGKLESVKAAVQRRANRRIIFRQDGDRLVPVGITSSATPGEEFSRRRRAQRNLTDSSAHQRQTQYGAELEELMVMEAMRLSLLEEEERKQKDKLQEEERLKGIELAISDATAATTSSPRVSAEGCSGDLRSASSISSVDETAMPVAPSLQATSHPSLDEHLPLASNSGPRLGEAAGAASDSFDAHPSHESTQCLSKSAGDDVAPQLLKPVVSTTCEPLEDSQSGARPHLPAVSRPSS